MPVLYLYVPLYHTYAVPLRDWRLSQLVHESLIYLISPFDARWVDILEKKKIFFSNIITALHCRVLKLILLFKKQTHERLSRFGKGPNGGIPFFFPSSFSPG